MAKKKKRPGGGHKPHGHYCKVCGEHKANEKFSGKGHAAHICKKCAALPVVERNEMMAVSKIEGMAFRHLNESEIKWLRNHLNDPRPAVREAAKEAHGMKFPRFERNMIKKGLTAFSLELYIHDEVVNEWGDFIPVNARVFAEDTGLFRVERLDDETASREVQIDTKDAKRFLKAVIHELDALFWDEDYGKAPDYDTFLDILPEYRTDFENEDDELNDEPEVAPPEERELVWSLRLELNNGEDKEMLFYDEVPDVAADLYWSLMDYIEPDEDDDFDEDDAPL